MLDAGGGSGLAVVVLAAGQGTRMRSDLPKVLHEAAGRPLLEHVLRAVGPLHPERTVIVVGHGADEVRDRFEGWGLDFVVQERQLGTGHAFLQSREVLDGHDGPILVLTGDAPLLTAATLQRLVAAPGPTDAMAVLTCELDEPGGYGRILRDVHGNVAGIVEEKDATEKQRAIREVNSGTFLFVEGALDRAERLGNDNAAGEYYLTDLVGMVLDDGHGVTTAPCADPREALGVNTRNQLATAEAVLRERIRQRWLDDGVTMLDPDTTYLDPDVTFETDVVIEPGVYLRGATRVGKGARIGAYACLDDCTVTPGSRVPPHTVASGTTMDSDDRA